MVDFSTPDAEGPLDSFQIPNGEEDPHEEHLRELYAFDVFAHNEEKILLCFRDDAIAFLNLPKKEFNLIIRPITSDTDVQRGANVSLTAATCSLY